MGTELKPNPASVAPPPRALAGQWHGAGLTDLIERLRSAGFRAGPAETVTAGRLLTRLAQRPNPPQRREDLLAWLRPVFCSTREEQARFDAIFLDWARRFGMAWMPRAAPGVDPMAAIDGATAASAPTRPRWGPRDVAAVLAVLGFALAIAWGVWSSRSTPAVDAPATPASQASAPGPSASAAAGGFATAASGPTLQGLFPAQRESRALRPERVWPLLAAPLLLWLLIGGLPGLQLMQGRQRSGRRVVLDTRALADEARQSLPTLTPAVAGRLERHVRADSGEGAPLARRRRLDARRTVEATLRNHGLLSPRYRLAPLRPSYLMLIDAHNEHDPRGRLFYLWAERLKREGLSVDIRLFRPGVGADTAPVCWQGLPAGSSGDGRALDDLEDPPPGQRLVVISEAPAWLTTEGAWLPWFARARLARWPQRVFFTPTELRDWGTAEEAVERPEHAADPGFLSLPLDESALDAWSVLLANGSLPAFSLAEPQRFPRVLTKAGFDPFAAPETAELDRLMAQLKLYLGDSGFRWLAALAVPPLVRWELTLLLGRALFDHRAALIGERWRDVLGRGYRRLARLPWLRGGTDAQGQHHAPALPDWLRLRLLDELPPDAQAEIRLVVDRLLSRLKPEAGGDLPIDLETPPQEAARAGAGASGDGDALYLGYLSGLTPRQLALRLPGGWADWLKSERLAEPGWSARALRSAAFGREWAHAKLARLAFRDGLPWSRRRLLPLGLSAALLGSVVLLVGALERTRPGDLSPAIDSAFFERTIRAVELPSVANPRAIAISPDGRWALGWGEGEPLRLWDTASGRRRHDFPGGRDALSARFDAGGSHVLACDASGIVRAWPLDGGAATLVGGLPTDPGARFLDCQFSADGRVRLLQPVDGDTRLLVTPDAPQALRLTDTAAALLSPNGRWVLRVASGGERTTLNLSVWSIAGGRALPGQFSGEAAWIDWAGDTLALLVSEGGAHSLVLRDLQRGAYFSLALDDDPAGKGSAEATPQPYALALSADARYAAIGDTAGGVALWDIEARRRIDQRRVHPAGRVITALRLSDDASVLLSSSADGDLRVSRAWQPSLVRSDEDTAQTAISADGRRVAFAHPDGRVVLREVDDPASSVTLSGLAPAGLLAFSADGRRLVQTDTKGSVRLWLAPGVGPAVDLPSGGADGPLVLRFDAEGQRLSWLNRDGRLLTRAVDRAAASTDTSVDTGGAISVAVRRADGTIAAVATSGEIRLIAPGGAVRRLGTAPGGNPRLAFSNLGRMLLVHGISPAGARLQAWDVASGRLRLGSPWATNAADGNSQFSADDLADRIATVDSNGRLGLIDFARNQRIEVTLPDRREVSRARWLRDGRLLVVERSGAARAWTLRGDGRAEADALALDLEGDVQRIELSGNGRRLIATATARSEVDAAMMTLKRLVDRNAQLRDGVDAVAPTSDFAQAKATVQSLSVQQQALSNAITAAEASVRSETAAAAGRRRVVGVWAVPAAQPARTPTGWLGEREGPHPLVLGLAGLALAGVSVALSLQRTRRRLTRHMRAATQPEAPADLAEATP